MATNPLTEFDSEYNVGNFRVLVQWNTLNVLPDTGIIRLM